MGLPTIIALVALGIFLIPTIKGIAEGSSKTDEEKKQEAKKQTTREKEGLFGTIARIIIGDASFEKRKVNDAESRLKEIKRQQARDAGFKSVKQFEIAFDTNRDPNKFLPKDKDGNPIKNFQKNEPVKIFSRFGGQKRRFNW